MARRLLLLALALCLACADDPATADPEPVDSAISDATPPVADMGPEVTADRGVTDAQPRLSDAELPATDGLPPEPDMAPPSPDAAPPPPPMALDCVFDSDTVGQPQVELDVGPGSGERLRFVVRGLPAPGLIEQATLTFDSYDADHPGEEGQITVNGAGPLDLPANAAWDNMPGSGVVDITGNTVEGENRVAFGPGPLERSFFRIGNVRIAARARVDACPEGPPPPDPPPPEARVLEIRYPNAEYTNRRTWVLGCENNPSRAYAYTATGDEHEPTDCEGRYRRGGNRVGDALFTFQDVVEATYEIVIGSRHTENRNPNRALFLVNGEARRISQVSDRDFTSDVWGQRRLSGQVQVILRAEGQSDSVVFVRLVPVAQ